MLKIFTAIITVVLFVNITCLAQKGEPKLSQSPLQSEKVIVVKITSDASGWKTEIVRTDYGAPTLNIKKLHDVLLTASDASGKKIYDVAFDDPRVYYIDDGPGGENGRKTDATGSRYVMLPYKNEIAVLEIKGLAPAYKDVLTKFQVADRVKELK